MYFLLALGHRPVRPGGALAATPRQLPVLGRLEGDRSRGEGQRPVGLLANCSLRHQRPDRERGRQRRLPRLLRAPRVRKAAGEPRETPSSQP